MISQLRRGAWKLDAYMDLNVVVKVQLVVENIIRAVFAAVVKTIEGRFF